MKLRTLLYIVIFSYPAIGYAQQAGIYSQYMFNGMAINPAYAGYDGMLSFTALGRLQSIGLEGSPNTQMISGDTPLRNNKIGVGMQIYHENIGVTDLTGIYGAYSYKINYKQFEISMGLQAGVNFYKTNFSKLTTNDPGDPVFMNDTRSVTPNFGAGIAISNKHIFAGLSMPQMLKAGNGDKLITEEQPLIIFGGYVFKLTPGLKFRPSMLAKMVNGRPVEYNINAHLLLKEILWVGVSFRPVNALTFMMQLQITEQFYFGYAYDASLGEIRAIEGGSHEFMINYRFRFSNKGMLSPRYF